MWNWYVMVKSVVCLINLLTVLTRVDEIIIMSFIFLAKSIIHKPTICLIIILWLSIFKTFLNKGVG